LGAAIALAIYITLFSSIAGVASTSAYAQSTAYFSITLIAPTSNAARRQYASIIAGSLASVGIDAKVFYVTFSELDTRMFFLGAYNADGSINWAQTGTDFAHGGYDAGFIGWGATGLSPDSSFSNFLGDYSDWAPAGNNYYFYNSSAANTLMHGVYSTANMTLQQQDIWNLQAQILQDTPQITIYYNEWIIARDPALAVYGNNTVFNNVGFPSDVQHMSGKSTLNFAEAGNVFPDNNLNPLPTTTSNSFYALFIYAPVFEGLQELNSITSSYYLALANSISSTPDGLNWTVNFKPNNFQDGVPVTSDDYVFTFQSLFDPNGGYVGQGTMLAQLGTKGEFTYLNGTTVTDDQTPAGQAPATWYVTAIDKNTFSLDVPAVYAFMNMTWMTISPLPKHYFEQFAISTWNSLPYVEATGYTETWDKTVYGGNGSCHFVGPFGNGPYVLTNYDFTSNTANEVAWEGYWNATGLENIGQFTVKNYNVVWISGADAAVAAYKSGEVNQLDTNYALNSYVSTLQGIGANVIMGPELGYQEMGFNLMNPIWGTGTGTPAGTAAAAAAVRKAISYLVPRQLIVTSLLNGLGTPGITPWAPAYGFWFNPNLQMDPYDPTKAVAELALAGYSGGSAVIPPTPPAIVAQTYLVAGNPVEVSGVLTDPTSGATINGSLITLQASYDYSASTGTGTWTDVAETTTGAGGVYAVWFTPTQPGTVYLQWLNWPGKGTDTSPVFNETIITLSQALTDSLTPYAQSSQVTALSNSLSTFSTTVTNELNTLTSKVNSLQSDFNTASYVAYGAILIAIIALILALLLSRRKPQ
jgi:ABC-type transport system substrate-binding protein